MYGKYTGQVSPVCVKGWINQYILYTVYCILYMHVYMNWNQIKCEVSVGPSIQSWSSKFNS